MKNKILDFGGLNFQMFVKSYLGIASWTTCDSDENQNFTRDAQTIAKKDCQLFIDKVINCFGKIKAMELLTIGGNDLPYLAAHDFWLTRNHHGAGFWDKKDVYGKENSNILTKIAESMKEVDCYHIRGKKSKLCFD